MWRAGVESRGACLLGERHSCTNDEVKQTKTKKEATMHSRLFFSLFPELLARVASVSGAVFFFYLLLNWVLLRFSSAGGKD